MNNKIVVTRNNSGLLESLFAFRMYPAKNGKSPFEKSTGKEPNTIKRLVINRDQFISEPAHFKLTETDFDSGQDSTILVRERTRRRILEGASKKRKGILLYKTDHAVSFLPAGIKEHQPFSQKETSAKQKTRISHIAAKTEMRLMNQSKKLAVSRQNNQSQQREREDMCRINKKKEREH